MSDSEPVELSDITDLLRAFEQHGVRYVLVGSMAMAALGVVRATQDVDFFVASDAANVGHLRAALKDVFHDDSVDDISSDDLAGDYPVVRYGPPAPNDFLIDFIGRLGDAYGFDDIEAAIVAVDGLSATVATPQMLYRMKRDTLRPKDQIDAEALRQRFGIKE